MVGITSYGAYIPQKRLSRKSIVEANAWGNGALKALGKGERSMCNWDEDSLTMAVAAGRDCLKDRDRATIQTVMVASTSLPFLDRQHAGVIAGALNLETDIHTMDITSSQKAGTSSLFAALEMARNNRNILMIASEQKRTKSGSTQELRSGDAAAALTLGTENVIATYLGGHSKSADFLDHYRAEGKEFDYTWEERWIRDEGYMKIVPPVIEKALQNTGLSGGDIQHFILPCVFPQVPKALAKKFSFSETAMRDTLAGVCGDTGTAHSLLMLVDVLSSAKKGEKIMVVGWGNGCDVLIFEATEALAGLSARKAVKGNLANRFEETNYNKFLTFNNLVIKEFGIRAEADLPTPLTALYRNTKTVLGMVGGKCMACQTPQFPKSDICVNPECNKNGTQTDHIFTDQKAKIKTYTADFLLASLDPPGMYGMVEFDEGGRFMMEFTDLTPEEIEVGIPMEMSFRMRGVDSRRGLRNYFWKAVPIRN